MFAKVKTSDKAIKNLLHCKTVPYKCIIKIRLMSYVYFGSFIFKLILLLICT